MNTAMTPAALAAAIAALGPRTKSALAEFVAALGQTEQAGFGVQGLTIHYAQGYPVRVETMQATTYTVPPGGRL